MVRIDLRRRLKIPNVHPSSFAEAVKRIPRVDQPGVENAFGLRGDLLLPLGIIERGSLRIGTPDPVRRTGPDAEPEPALAADVTMLLSATGLPVHQDQSRGLDHGAYVPLVEMFPAADIPVLQMSMPTLDPQQLFEIGRRIAPLRDQGTLIVGSGFTTHNLAWFNPSADADAPAPTASAEFDAWAREIVEAGDIDSALDFLSKAPAAREAHPRTEHFAPLFVSLGAAYESGGLESRSVIDGFWYGLSKRSWQFT